MAARFFLVLSASALLVQSIAAYPGCGCGLSGAANLGAGIAAANNLAGLGYGAPAYLGSSIYSGQAIASANGGAFGVSVASPFAPSGISVVSENSIDGALEVVGSLPVLATVALEGTVPSSGAAGTSYGCGNGNVGISSDSLAAAGIGATAGYGAAGYGAAGLNSAIVGAELAGINAGLAGAGYARPSCGCGAYAY